MSDHVFPDLAFLRTLIQSAIGPLVDVSWINDPEIFPGFSGLDVNGAQISGMPGAPPAVSVTASGSAAKITLRITAFVDRGWDDTRREYLISSVIPGGTLPPAITLTGDLALTGVENIDVRTTFAGARGAWTGEWSKDRKSTWVPFTSAPDVVLTGTGLTAHIATGNASLDNTWEANPIQKVTNIGLRHFTLSVKIEGDGINVWAVAERLRMYLCLKSSQSDLVAQHLALRSISPVVDLSNQTAWDNRAINAASLDVFMTYSSEMSDVRSSTANNWIETVNTTGRVPFVQ